MNNVTLIGNLTKEVELKQISESTLAEFAIAISEKVKKNGKYVDKPVFVNINVWGKSAENCAKFLSKGNKVAIVGKLNFSQWDDKETGAKRSKLDVMAFNVQFLTPKSDTTNHDNQPQQYQERGPVAPSQPVTDEVPF